MTKQTFAGVLCFYNELNNTFLTMKTTKFFYFLGLFLIILVSSGCNSGTQQNDSGVADNLEVDQDTTLVKEGDEELAATAVDLVLLAYMNNRMQYRMGEIAQQQARSEAVRSYAESIITGDKETRRRIEDMAEASNANLPEVIGATERVKIDSIRQLSDDKFDQAYMQEAIKQYRENVGRLNELILEADNPMIEGLAAEIIDTQQQHMERAEGVLQEIS
jgi:putative membrane protein